MAFPAAARVNIDANGFDWIEYTTPEKAELVATIYKVLKVDKFTIENGINGLDGLYYTYYREVKDSHNKEEAIKTVFSRPIMEIAAEILNISPDTIPDKEMLKKYRQGAITNRESGVRQPELGRLEGIAKALKATPEEPIK